MTTLATCIPATGEEPAVIVPGSPALSITYSELHAHIKSFQQKLAELGVKDLTPVSIALPNSFAFIVSFLATTWQRGIAAPLNPAYKQGVRDISLLFCLVHQLSTPILTGWCTGIRVFPFRCRHRSASGSTRSLGQKLSSCSCRQRKKYSCC